MKAGLAVAVLMLFCSDAMAASGWLCARRLANGDCIGPATFNEDGESTAGVRGYLGSDQLVWLGKLTHLDRLRVRTVCSYAPTGRCEGELNTYFPNGKRRTESMRVVDGEDQYLGVSTTITPQGQRLECEVNRAGDCDGEAVLQLPSKEILHGLRKARGLESRWVGVGRWTFTGGQVKDCLLGEDGSCLPGPLTFWDRDSKTVGTLGPDNLLVGALAVFDRRGYRRACAVATAGSCRARDLVVTRAPPGAWEKPRPKKASAARPAEIRAGLAPTVYIAISPPPDSGEIRYQFIACGDDIRIAYTIARATRPRLPFQGQVWYRAELIGRFSDPGAARLPMNQLGCKSAQTRSVASLNQYRTHLVQHTFVDGYELWSTEEMIRHFLDGLSVRAFPVIGPELAAPQPLPVPVPAGMPAAGTQKNIETQAPTKH